MHPSEFDSLTADRLQNVVGAKWTTYDGCIGAFVAEMDFGTAPAIRDELRRVVDDGFFGYLPKRAMTDMQQATSDWYRIHYNWDIPIERIRPLPDVLACMVAALTDFLEPGRKVILPTPAYMPFLFLPQMFEREIIQVPSLFRNDRWEMDYDGIDAAFAAGGGLMVLCNPHNPLGRVYDRDELTQLADIVARHDGRVFADEIHAPLTYSGHQHIPYAAISESAANHTITAASASKAWNLAGMKCAQAILSSEQDVETWSKNGLMTEHGASTLGVIANTAAYTHGEPWLDEVTAYLDGNRRLLGELLQEQLPEVGYVMPEGTYLAWLDFRPTGIGDEVDSFFREHAKVAITNGAACGDVGKGHVRLNLAMSRSMLIETVSRMASAVRAASTVGATA